MIEEISKYILTSPRWHIKRCLVWELELSVCTLCSDLQDYLLHYTCNNIKKCIVLLGMCTTNGKDIVVKLIT